MAQGIAFSVPNNVPVPPLLKNIFTEMNNDIEDFNIPNHGCLIELCKKGVFLFNIQLTGEIGKSMAHNGVWDGFSIKLMKRVFEKHPKIPIIAWGMTAQKFASNVAKKNIILEGDHPSSNKGEFFDGKYFSRANEILIDNELSPIDWTIDDIDE